MQLRAIRDWSWFAWDTILQEIHAFVQAEIKAGDFTSRG